MQVTFDTAIDTIANVLAVTHAAYGLTGAAPAPVITTAAPTGSIPIAPNDNPAAGVDTTQKDKDGLPWDARVHSTPPTMNSDGMWRAKRSRKEEEYAAVKASYAPAVAAGTAMPPAAPQTPPAAPQTPPAAPAPLAPAMPAPLVPATPAVITAYTQLSDYLARAIAAKTNGCSAEWVKDSLGNMGVADGELLNLQGETDEKLFEIMGQFKAVLGEV